MAVLVSQSYAGAYYPLTTLLPPTIFFRRPHSTAVQCLGFHGSFNVEQYNHNSRKHWDEFYERHQNKFFKDRHYLEKDWGQYFCDDNTIPSNGKIILEAGCGVGNTIFPLIKKYPQLYVHACDFSHHAINLVKDNPLLRLAMSMRQNIQFFVYAKDVNETKYPYKPRPILTLSQGMQSDAKFREDQMNVFVCNIAEDDLCDHIMPSSLDIATLIFTLSAVCPENMPNVIQNLGHVLKPNGVVLLRDYAIGDYAQEMLITKNQVISDNFYFRGDGTSSFYFSEDFLSNMFVRAGFSIVDVNTYNREIKNRSKNITMQRRWIRAVFRRC